MKLIKKATRFLSKNTVQVTTSNIDAAGAFTLQGIVREKEKSFNPSLTIDTDERIIIIEIAQK